MIWKTQVPSLGIRPETGLEVIVTGRVTTYPGRSQYQIIIETMAHFGARSVMAQRFIPEIVDGDKRIILIDGEPAPHVLARIPRAGETRGNLAAGGRGVARPLTPRDREIAETIGRALAPKGLFVIGLDVIGDYLTEVNVTSPTGFVEISQQTGFDVAGAFAQALEKSVGAR